MKDDDFDDDAIELAGDDMTVESGLGDLDPGMDTDLDLEITEVVVTRPTGAARAAAPAKPGVLAKPKPAASNAKKAAAPKAKKAAPKRAAKVAKKAPKKKSAPAKKRVVARRKSVARRAAAKGKAAGKGSRKTAKKRRR